MRPKKVKPAIYSFNDDGLALWQRGGIKEAKWGWVDIKELAEIVGLPKNCFACRSPYLEFVYDYFYEACGAFSRQSFFRSINGVPALAFAVEKHLDGLWFYEIIYLTREYFFECGDRSKTLSAGNFFVPAGWAIKLIEVERERNRKVAEFTENTDKGRKKQNA